MTSVLDAIEERVHKRRERWHTQEVSYLPDPTEIGEPTIVGRYARCGTVTKRRYIDTGKLVAVNGSYETPSSVARDYLILKYRYGPRWTGTQRDRILQEVTGAPLFVKPTTFRDGAYIDLRAAYWSVMIRLGWNVDYFPGRWLARTDPPLDFPWQYDKRARNCLVSVSRASKVTMWRPDKGYTQEVRPNPRPNTQLFCLIMDCLNGVASDMVDAGAVYVFTDGYISPDRRTTERCLARASEWGFEVRIKGVGAGWVTNLGSYAVGDMRSKFRDRPAAHLSVKRLPYHAWLKDKMARAASDAPWHRGSVTQESYRDRYKPKEAA